jgi:hypothetical protein
MAVLVEWRSRNGADAILLNQDGRIISEVPELDEVALDEYLAVAGNLARWQEALSWRPVSNSGEEPIEWGDLVFSRMEDGAVDYVDPELFWEGIYRWFRSRGVDFGRSAEGKRMSPRAVSGTTNRESRQ